MPALLRSGLTGPESFDDCIVYVTSKHSIDQLGHRLAMGLRAAHAHLRRRSNLAFSAFQMTADQYVLLSVLVQEGEATQQELVRRCCSDTATIGTMLALMEKKKLVTRTPDPRDGRALRVRLTRSGARLAEEMRQSSSGVRANLVGVFNEQELHRLIEYLDRLAGAMCPPARRTKSPQPRRQKSHRK